MPTSVQHAQPNSPVRVLLLAILLNLCSHLRVLDPRISGQLFGTFTAEPATAY